MTIAEYIQKHQLKKRPVRSEGYWIPAGLAVPEGDEFSVFGNDDGTHVVVINDTKKRFKIMHADMVTLESDWLDARNNYVTDASPFWDRPA